VDSTISFHIMFCDSLYSEVSYSATRRTLRIVVVPSFVQFYSTVSFVMAFAKLQNSTYFFTSVCPSVSSLAYVTAWSS